LSPASLVGYTVDATDSDASAYLEWMTTRVDWFDDSDAPQANSLAPTANVIVEDDDGRILMIRQTGSGNYALPGGAMELGEAITDTAVREAKEETGYDVEISGLSGIYTDPAHLVEYTSTGEVRQEFSIVFTGEIVGGAARLNDEASEIAWVPSATVDDLPMAGSAKERIGHYLGDSIYLG